MSGLTALEKLRTAARNMARGRNLETHEECNLLLVIADEIDGEIAERFMELPVDADGVSIKLGDKVVIPQCYEGIVVSIEVGDMETLIGVDGHDGYLRYGNSDIRHVRPRAVEDVLSEFASRVLNSGHQWGLDAPDVVPEYAAEIRELMEVER